MSGFDPSRDVGVAYKLQKAGVDMGWRQYENMTHGWMVADDGLESGCCEGCRGVGRGVEGDGESCRVIERFNRATCGQACARSHMRAWTRNEHF